MSSASKKAMNSPFAILMPWLRVAETPRFSLSMYLILSSLYCKMISELLSVEPSLIMMASQSLND